MTHFSRLTPRRQAALLSLLRWVSLLVVAFLLAVFGYYLYVNVLNRAPAQVYVAQRGTAIAAVYGTVTINPDASLALFAQNSGFLHAAPDLANSIQAQGIAVKRDQLLGTVVDEIGLRALHDAQTNYDAAVARQKTGPPSAGPLKSAEQNLAALEKLPPGNVPQVQRDSARNAVNQFTTAVTNETLALNHDVETTASALKATQDEQTRTLIKAPFDGILTAAGFGDNAYVLVNQMVYTIATLRTNVTGQVNEEDIGSLRGGMKAEVNLYAYGNDKTFTATLRQVLPSPDANSSRYTVILYLDAPPDDLKFGLTGQMNIILGRKEHALRIPTRALTDVDQVFIVDDGVVAQRTVKTGFRTLEFTEVTDGLKDGALVIVADQETFHPGERVRPVRINDASTGK